MRAGAAIEARLDAESHTMIHGDTGRQNFGLAPDQRSIRSLIDFEYAGPGPVSRDLAHFLGDHNKQTGADGEAAAARLLEQYHIALVGALALRARAAGANSSLPPALTLAALRTSVDLARTELVFCRGPSQLYQSPTGATAGKRLPTVPGVHARAVLDALDGGAALADAQLSHG
jgi:Ser/Thr protein kinase RdoA (MazF antagonist)